MLGRAGLSRPAHTNDAAGIRRHGLGTIPYTAPETFQDQCINKASDVYAFGILRASLPLVCSMCMWEYMTMFLTGGSGVQCGRCTTARRRMMACWKAKSAWACATGACGPSSTTTAPRSCAC